MSTRRKIMWIGICLATLYLVFFFIIFVAPTILGFQMTAIRAHQMAGLAGRFTAIILLFGLVWIVAFRKTANKNKS